MMTNTALPRRTLDDVNRYAPTLDVMQLNERATDAWASDARHDPTGVEAQGLDDILAVRRKLVQLYWCNTLARRG